MLNIRNLQARTEYPARLIMINAKRVHYYPKDGSQAISFKLQHDAFLVGKEITYHADGESITCLPSHGELTLMVEKWLDEGLADRIVIK